VVARAFEDIAGARHEAQALYDIAQALTSTQTVDQAVDAIVERLKQLMPVEAGVLFLWGEEAARFRCRYTTATGAPHATLMAVNAETIGDLRMRLEETVAPLSHGAQPDVLVAMLKINDRLLGALGLVGAYGGSRVDQQRLLEHVAPQVALVVQNAITFEETLEQSVTDPLTGLPNRRRLLQHLGVELARADRYHHPVALLLIDVNDFKEINDTHGHHSGDQVLCEIGRIMRAGLRPYDMCARFGGDEFVLVLWDCDARMAERRREELEEAIAAEPPLEAIAGTLPSVSIGIAMYPGDGRDAARLIAAADQRMYERKARRRADLAKSA
jgi:diguanylate cyclase (GGDEF)-like protein